MRGQGALRVQTKADKHRRKKNFSEREIQVLNKEVMRHENILRMGNKRSGEWQRIWDSITWEINAVGGARRTVSDVKHRWRDDRLRARKNKGVLNNAVLHCTAVGHAVVDILKDQIPSQIEAEQQQSITVKTEEEECTFVRETSVTVVKSEEGAPPSLGGSLVTPVPPVLLTLPLDGASVTPPLGPSISATFPLNLENNGPYQNATSHKENTKYHDPLPPSGKLTTLQSMCQGLARCSSLLSTVSDMALTVNDMMQRQVEHSQNMMSVLERIATAVEMRNAGLPPNSQQK